MPFPSLTHWKTTTPRVPRSDSPLGAITVAGTIANSRGTGRTSMRVFGQWALVYLLAGEGEYSDERGTACLMKPGQWILVFPEIAHTYGPCKGSNWQEVFVGFQGPVFELWRRENLFNPDEFHFSKTFGQCLGISPRDYRRENRDRRT